jgi:hypothetical protein
MFYINKKNIASQQIVNNPYFFKLYFMRQP